MEWQLRCHFHGLNSQQDTIPAAAHDRGLRRGVPHCIKWGGELWPPLSQEARHGGSTHSSHNHTIDRECSGHLGHDDGSTVDGGAMAGYRPPLRAMECLSGGVASASPRSVTQH
jgi:hypothetical protein